MEETAWSNDFIWALLSEQTSRPYRSIGIGIWLLITGHIENCTENLIENHD